MQLSLQLKGAAAAIAHWVIACANRPLTRAITPRCPGSAEGTAQPRLQGAVPPCKRDQYRQTEGMKKQHSSLSLCLFGVFFKGQRD